MTDYSGVFVAFDMAKTKRAVAIAENVLIGVTE